MIGLDSLLVPIQALLICAIVTDDNIRKFAVLFAATSSLDNAVQSALADFLYYERQALFSSLLCCASLYIQGVKKCVAIQLICGFSAFTALYELSSYYQTFWYPYHDSFEWWSVEVIMLIAIANEHTVFDDMVEKLRHKPRYTKRA